MRLNYLSGLCSLITLAGISLLYSCNGSKTNTTSTSGIKPLTDTLFSGQFDVRHFNFGMAREEFDLGDDSSVLENEQDLVVESVNFNSSDSVFAECSYHFEENVLQSSEVNIFSPTDSINTIVFDSVKHVFTRLYGAAVEAKGFFTWHTKGKKGYELEIFLGDMSIELGSPATQIQMHATIVEKALLAIYKPLR